MHSHEAFLERFLANEPSLRAFVRTIVRDRADYDDVFQSIVLVLWKNFAMYDAERPFGPWARSVAAREVFRLRRRSGNRATPFSPEVVESILDSYERHSELHDSTSERVAALEACVESLPDESRRLLSLRYRQSMTIDEISSVCGKTEASIQRALSRLRYRLAECIERRLKPIPG